MLSRVSVWGLYPTNQHNSSNSTTFTSAVVTGSRFARMLFFYPVHHIGLVHTQDFSHASPADSAIVHFDCQLPGFLRVLMPLQVDGVIFAALLTFAALAPGAVVPCFDRVLYFFAFRHLFHNIIVAAFQRETACPSSSHKNALPPPQRYTGRTASPGAGRRHPQGGGWRGSGPGRSRCGGPHALDVAPGPPGGRWQPVADSPECTCFAGVKPRAAARFPWGSLSTSRTRLPEAASAAPRFSAMVVLMPPFWLVTEMNLFNIYKFSL